MESGKSIPELCMYCDSPARAVCTLCGAGICRGHTERLGSKEAFSLTHPSGRPYTVYGEKITSTRFICKVCKTRLKDQQEHLKPEKKPHAFMKIDRYYKPHTPIQAPSYKKKITITSIRAHARRRIADLLKKEDYVCSACKNRFFHNSNSITRECLKCGSNKIIPYKYSIEGSKAMK